MTGETGMSLAVAGRKRQAVQTARRLTECSRKWSRLTIDWVLVVVAAVTTGLRRLLSCSWWAGGNDLTSASDDLTWTTNNRRPHLDDMCRPKITAVSFKKWTWRPTSHQVMKTTGEDK